MGTATYKKVYSELAGAVRDGTIKSGTSISVRALAKKYNVNKNTAHRIMQELRKSGLLEVRAGKSSRLVFDGKLVAGESSVSGVAAITGSVVLLSSGAISNVESNFVSMELIEGFSRAAREQGLTLEVVHGAPDDLDAVATSLVQKEDLLGVCLTSCMQFPIASKLREHDIVTVSLNIPSAGQVDYEILCDDLEATGMAVGHLWDLGHRRIGYIGVGPDSVLSRRYYGYCLAMMQRGGQVVPNQDWMYLVDETGVYQEADVLSHLKEILGQEQRPTALVFSGDSVAYTAVSGLKLLGCRIPEDIAFVSYDNSYLATDGVPAWTSISLPRRDVALEAVNVLKCRALGENSRAPYRVFVPELVVRDSCGGLPPLPANQIEVD